MAKKKQSINIPSLIITVIAVLLAAAAVVFLVIMFQKRADEQKQQSTNTPKVTVTDHYIPTEDLLRSAEQAAYDLLPKNYKVYQYLTKGMTVKEEPYGNKPDDGFYTCANDDYKTFEDLSKFVRSIYTSQTAEKLLTDPFGNGPVYGDDNGELGLSAEFKATEEEGLSWANVTFVCSMDSETVCNIEITLKDKDGKDVKKEVKMIKENEQWRLEALVG